MRILITTSPGIGHIFPTISTAWALRAAGHDVMMATGGHHEVASHAGLAVVDTAPGVDFVALFQKHARPAEGQAARAWGRQPGVDGAPEMEFVARLFAAVSREFTDETVRLARSWRPDLVLFSPLQGVGPLAAQAVGVPAVMHGLGINNPPELWQAVAEHMAEDYEKFGLTPPESAGLIDVTPPSMVVPEAMTWANRLAMRYVPYNGGAVLPDWLSQPRTRPRITVTLGSVVPLMAGVGGLVPFLAAAAEVPADFVVTRGGVDEAAFGPVPANVRLVDWVPLGTLLRDSDAVIHHGGSGTTLTVLDAGLPQLVLPHGADQFLNAAAVAKAGAGAAVTADDLVPERLAGLLTDTAARSTAEAIAKEMAGQPTPADIVPALIALAS